MLRQESTTTNSHPTTGAARLDYDLLPGTTSLIKEIRERLLAGESINNPTLTEMAERAYGGSRARGTYTVHSSPSCCAWDGRGRLPFPRGPSAFVGGSANRSRHDQGSSVGFVSQSGERFSIFEN